MTVTTPAQPDSLERPTGPSLSPSRAADFKTCPLLFRYRTIDRLPERATADQVRGTLVHAVLEHLFDLPAAERTPEAAAALVAPEWTRLVEQEPSLAALFEEAVLAAPVGPGAAGPGAVAAGAAGPDAVSAGAAGPGTLGSGAVGPDVVGADVVGADAVGPGTESAGAARPRGLGPDAAGPRDLGPDAAGPGAVGSGAVGPDAVGVGAIGPEAVGASAVGRGVVGAGAATSGYGEAEQPVLDGMPSDEGARLAAFLRGAGALLDGYFAVEDPRRLEPAEREALVSTLVDDELLIRGYIDRLDISPAGDLRVVDYKTGGAPREAFEGRALFQLKFYALVLWRTRGVVPKVLRLLYLKDAEVCDYSPDAEELERFERTLLALSEAIERAKRERDFRPKPSRLCGWCSHQAFCPEFGGTILPYPEPREVTVEGPPEVGADPLG